MPQVLIPFDPQSPAGVLFPEHCLMCGAPAQQTIALTAEGKSARRVAHVADLLAPYCAEHAAQALRNRRWLMDIFWAAGLVIFAALLFFVLPPKLDNADRVGFVLAFAVAAGILARLVQRAARTMLEKELPGMAETPLTLPLLGRGGSAMGIDARVIAAADRLVLVVRLNNASVAADLARINHGEVSEES